MYMPDWVYRNIEVYTNTLIPRKVAEKHSLEEIKKWLESKYKIPFKVWVSEGRTFAERLGQLDEPRRTRTRNPTP